MKLTELIFANNNMPEKDLRDLSWFETGEAITSLEGNNYFLFKKENVYFVKSASTNKLAGWVEIKNINEVSTIYVLPDYRNKGIGLVLLHAVKELLEKVIFPDVVSPDGSRLIDRMVNHPNLFKLSVIQNGKTVPYDKDLLKKTDAKLLIEGKIGDSPLTGLSAPGVPGINDPLKRSAWTWFKNEK